MAINKPNNVPLLESEDSDFGLKYAIPQLAALLGVEKLHYIRGPERYYF